VPQSDSDRQINNDEGSLAVLSETPVIQAVWVVHTVMEPGHDDNKTQTNRPGPTCFFLKDHPASVSAPQPHPQR